MMNRCITPWHKPDDCYEACLRTEKVMNQLKALVRSLEENEQEHKSHQHQQATTRSPIGCDDKSDYPKQGPQSRLPVPNFHPQCRCGKRNGLQDYCGELKKCCYMNPNANCEGARIDEPRHQQPQKFPTGDHKKSQTQEEYICSRHGEDNMINDFYMIPAEKCRRH